MTDKIKTCEDMAALSTSLKESGKLIGFTNGCFDILHIGHVRYLAEAKKNCDILVVGVNSDNSVKRLKGETRPVNPELARLEVLSALECVDIVVLFDEDTPENLIKIITPDRLFKGGDWKEEDIAGGPHVKSNGGKVMVIPFVEGYSTTGIIEIISDKI